MSTQQGHPALKAGAACTDITPPLGVAMAGYRRTRYAKGIHDPLCAKALVLDDGRTQIALVALDLICISKEHVDRARESIEKRCGIPPERVMCWATHIHTGPVTHEDMPAGDPDEEYMALLPRKIADSVEIAQGNLREARWGVGLGRQEGLSFNRRANRRGRPLPPGTNELLQLLREGIVPQGPEIGLEEWEEKASAIDPEVGVLYFEGTDGSPIATLVNFALHCDTVGGELFSAGYPYYLSQVLKQAKGEDMIVLFANGPCGDINHIDRRRGPRKGFGEAERIGTILAGEALKVLADMEMNSSISLRAAGRRLVLPRKTISEEEIEAAKDVLKRVPPDQDRRERFYAEDLLHLVGTEEEIRTEVQAVVLGDAALVALPGEVFVELGLEIKRRSPFMRTFVVELADDYVGYVPTREAFCEGGYEVMTARTSKLAPGAGEMMVEAALELLEQLARGRKELSL